MSWETSSRRDRLPEDWDQRRRAVLARCGGRCEAYVRGGGRCPHRATDVDHKRPGDDHSMRNLQGLCSTHHGIKSSREGAAARRALRALRRRPPEDHPGRLS